MSAPIDQERRQHLGREETSEKLHPPRWDRKARKDERPADADHHRDARPNTRARDIHTAKAQNLGQPIRERVTEEEGAERKEEDGAQGRHAQKLDKYLGL